MSPLPEARKVLVMELAGLGDNVHLIPALWLVRRRWPEAELHLMVNAHVASLFKLTPWVNRILPYPSSPKPGLRESLRWAGELRREKYDVVVNTTGADRSSLLTWATRAPRRIGRRPADGGPPGWSALYTDVVEQPFYREPMFRQKWRCLFQAGFPAGAEPEFKVEIDPALRRQAGIEPGDEGTYFHVSPFTTADERELPAEQVVELIAGLRAAYPEKRIALSCAATDRERDRMGALLAQVKEPPWRVYAGTLDVAALAAVIEKCTCNLSGDTGSLHLAMMTRSPAVAWFRAHRGEKEWTPEGPRYRVLVSEGGARDALNGIETRALLQAVAKVA